MKTVTIPDNMNPWECCINGKKYRYPAGETVDVPDEVAAIIQAYENATKAPEAEPVLTQPRWGSGLGKKEIRWEKTSYMSDSQDQYGCYCIFRMSRAEYDDLISKPGFKVESYDYYFDDNGESCLFGVREIPVSDFLYQDWDDEYGDGDFAFCQGVEWDYEAGSYVVISYIIGYEEGEIIEKIPREYLDI